jgi:hypothetical protein
MIAIVHRHSSLDAPACPTRRDENAYVLLEHARLRCEQLRDTAELRDQSSALVAGHALDAAHRELGLAGFYASSEIPADSRRAWLALAHELANRPTVDVIDALDSASNHALSAVETGLGASAGSDHLHRAHFHLLIAREFLQPLLPRRSSSLFRTLSTWLRRGGNPRSSQTSTIPTGGRSRAQFGGSPRST